MVADERHAVGARDNRGKLRALGGQQLADPVLDRNPAPLEANGTPEERDRVEPGHLAAIERCDLHHVHTDAAARVVEGDQAPVRRVRGLAREEAAHRREPGDPRAVRVHGEELGPSWTERIEGLPVAMNYQRQELVDALASTRMGCADASLMDMNGDGLVDRVFAGNPVTVAVNTGSGFLPPTPFGGSLDGLNSDVNANFGGGAYFTATLWPK